ncbi:MAG: hypothetical protein WBB07_24155 [Mycobacterium sp.]
MSASACGGGSEAAKPSTVTVTSSVVVTAPAAAPAPPLADGTAAPVAPAAGAPAPLEASWTMPNLIGRNLQDAQDSIQALTEFQNAFSTSTDLTGKGRAQIMDRNWQVCSSTPAPGTTITAATLIDFGVVRIDTESCP